MKHSRNSRLTVVSLFVVTTAAAAVWATTGRVNTDQLRVENKTRALLVESVKDLGAGRAGARREHSRFEVTVRNGYDKPVAAYSIRVEDGSTDEETVSAVERGGLVDDWALPPNGTDTTLVAASPGGKEVVLTVFAVMFEDGTGDGDADDLTRLQETRAGVRMAYQQIAPILRRSLNRNHHVAPDAAVQSLEDEVASISDRGVPENLRRGFTQAKSHVGLGLGELKGKLRSQPGLGHQTEITKRLEKIENALAKL